MRCSVCRDPSPPRSSYFWVSFAGRGGSPRGCGGEASVCSCLCIARRMQGANRCRLKHGAEQKHPCRRIQLLLIQVGGCMLLILFSSPHFSRWGVYWCTDEGRSPSQDTVPSASPEHEYQRVGIWVEPTGPSQSVRVCEGKSSNKHQRIKRQPALLCACRQGGESSVHITAGPCRLVHDFASLTVVKRSNSLSRNGGRCFGRGNQTASGWRLMGEQLNPPLAARWREPNAFLCLCGALPTETMTAIIARNLLLY